MDEILNSDGVTFVVKIGDTVRRPIRPFTSTVQSYLTYIRDNGFKNTPEPLGYDEEGKEILSYVEGEVPIEPLPDYATSNETLSELAKLQRRLHDASQNYLPGKDAIWGEIPGGKIDGVLPLFEKSELISHMDYCPGNVVFKDKLPIAFIDFDLACPTTRVVDIVNMLHWWAPLIDPIDRAIQLQDVDMTKRISLFADSYDMTISQRELLMPTAKLRAHNSFLKCEAASKVDPVFKRWWDESWKEQIPRTIAWLDTNSDAINAALL